MISRRIAGQADVTLPGLVDYFSNAPNVDVERKDMSASMYFTKRQELVTRQIAGETVIIPVRGGVGDFNSIYTLNQPGTLIWDLLTAGTQASEIATAVCREYDVTQEVAEKDIAEFLGSLQAEGLIYSSVES